LGEGRLYGSVAALFPDQPVLSFHLGANAFDDAMVPS